MENMKKEGTESEFSCTCPNACSQDQLTLVVSGSGNTQGVKLHRFLSKESQMNSNKFVSLI